MTLQQISIRLMRADVARIEALLSLAEPLALTFDDALDAPLFEPAPGETPLWPELILRALFAHDYDTAALSEVLRSTLPPGTRIELRQISEADWRAGLEQAVFVQDIAPNLRVVPAEHEPAANAVRLHMGLAFGTGRHPTTHLCLKWLAQHPPAGLSVCDLGCGSGVLAIAALKLGATAAIAIDNEPQALQATLDNAKLNDCTEQLRVGPPGAFAQSKVDLVLANILAGTLMDNVATIAAFLRPGGTIVLSGVLADQADAVRNAFSERFERFEFAVREDWARIVARLR